MPPLVRHRAGMGAGMGAGMAAGVENWHVFRQHRISGM